jgi:hypothetical protein
VEPEFEAGNVQFGDEIETTNSRPDDRNGLRGVLSVMAFPLCVEAEIARTSRCRDYAASAHWLNQVPVVGLDVC